MDYLYQYVNIFYLLGLLAIGLGIPRETSFSRDLQKLCMKISDMKDDVCRRCTRSDQRNVQKTGKSVWTNRLIIAVLLAFSPTRIHAPPQELA